MDKKPESHTMGESFFLIPPVPVILIVSRSPLPRKALLRCHGEKNYEHGLGQV
jgi:hypothetical protein